MTLNLTRSFGHSKPWLLVLTVLAVLSSGGVSAAPAAGARPAALPNEAPIPVVRDAAAADAALEAARKSGKALVVDLTRGAHMGVVVRAKTVAALIPGRYRLHALVASTPHDHILVEAVSLRLTAGENSDSFERMKWFRAPGRLSPVHLDAVVREAGILTIGADWFVGDSKLDRSKYNNQEGEARRVYRLQRQQAIDQQTQAGPEASADEAPGLDDEQDDATAKLAPRTIADDDLPTYRLLLSGLVLERLSPVTVVSVKTDAPAYAFGATGRVTAELRNWGAEPVSAQLAWSVADDARPGVVVAKGVETVALVAGETRAQELTDPLQTGGIKRLGRVRVEAGIEGLRGDASWTPFVILPERGAPLVEQPRKVFAHYMGCYPAGTGVTRYHRLSMGEDFRHDRGGDVERRGGRFRNFDLVPAEPGLTADESADLEIRRAMRIGINGFAVDAWAGGDGAKATFDALIRVAKAKNYPFELTICLDPACGGDPVHSVKELLAKYGDNPKLARRDGQPLIFGYFSHGLAMGALNGALDERLTEAQRKGELDRLRTTELGWHLIGQSFRKAAEGVGQPVCYTYDLVYFFHGVEPKLVKPGMMTKAAATIALHVAGMGSFGAPGFGYGDRTEAVAKAVREAGAEWGGLGGMHQKENILPGGGEIFMPRGTEWLRGMWGETIRDQASLIQLVTWNDYTENTNLAPAYNTRYTLYDLTGYYIDWWRAGKPPVVTRDRVYLTYAKYPKDAKAWPFTIKMRSTRALEVLTILTAPATVRLPGREIQYEAPAGLHVQQFPVTAGPVIAEIVRDGKTAVRLESPEPITDRPFREDNAMVCFSTEEARHWKADFGDTPFLDTSEYGDADGDGMPNWFEMYWFGKWLDYSTATKALPTADPDDDEISNLDEYRARTDPTMKAAPGEPEDPE
jgi:hypothetical protein